MCLFFFLPFIPVVGLLFPPLFLSFCLSRNAMTVNLESSVSVVETITPSALTRMLATPSMPISERVYSICDESPHPLTLTHLTHTLTLYFSCLCILNIISLCALQVLGICGEDPQCELQKGPTAGRPVPLGFVPASHPLRLPERGQLLLCPLRY